MNALSVFSFQENHPVRVVLIKGEPWFVALDIRGEVPTVGTAMSAVAAAVSA
ncbi:Uncharacterised protein [Enterobacter hormaechei]|uniref:hypothetical protein n=1 Tax=Enterobacter hormaechei TaxID=158836 RepID=UPI00079717CC|nr:hypothetical protein [Enterobacter hormaechei]SAB26615.1 Uncharacterised protein [Enterobacter hormaechei]